jgi:hypothetical protein
MRLGELGRSNISGAPLVAIQIVWVAELPKSANHTQAVIPAKAGIHLIEGLIGFPLLWDGVA